MIKFQGAHKQNSSLCKDKLQLFQEDIKNCMPKHLTFQRLSLNVFPSCKQTPNPDGVFLIIVILYNKATKFVRWSSRLIISHHRMKCDECQTILHMLVEWLCAHHFHPVPLLFCCWLWHSVHCKHTHPIWDATTACFQWWHEWWCNQQYLIIIHYFCHSA